MDCIGIASLIGTVTCCKNRYLTNLRTYTAFETSSMPHGVLVQVVRMNMVLVHQW